MASLWFGCVEGIERGPHDEPPVSTGTCVPSFDAFLMGSASQKRVAIGPNRIEACGVHWLGECPANRPMWIGRFPARPLHPHGFAWRVDC